MHLGQPGVGRDLADGLQHGLRLLPELRLNLERKGQACSVEDLAGYFVWLQEMRCHNVNWITPTHQVNFLVEALELAKGRGFRLPIVYNCGGYETPEVIRSLEGLVDIYLPDFK